jgi:hypothetical protein
MTGMRRSSLLPGIRGLLGLIVSWFNGLAVIVLLWQRSSSFYFRAAPRYQARLLHHLEPLRPAAGDELA